MSAVLFEVEDGVAVVTLNRPEARNAMNRAVYVGLAEAWARIANEPEIRCAVITGAGGVFCAGLDLKAWLAKEDMSVKGAPFGSDRAVLDKPLIAAVEGYALAGGFELMSVADIVVASEKAKFGLTEVKRGLIAAGGGVMIFPRHAPFRIVNEMVLTGDQMDAETLYRHGVINKVTPEGGALEGAMAYARSIAANGPLAVTACKRLMRESAEWPSDELYKRQQPIVSPVFNSEDAREGARAFAEKRAPQWKGR
jgi:enoyl-CoA hydratase